MSHSPARARHWPQHFWTCVVLAILVVPRIGYSQASPREAGAEPRVLAPIGSVEDDLARVRQLHGETTDGYLLRSLSRRVWSGGETGPAVRLIGPLVRTTWHSDIPDSWNEGWGWSGRGWSALTMAGAALRWGPVSVTLAPEVVYAQNDTFAIVPNELPRRSDYALWWFADTLSVDMPVRFGDDPRRMVAPGQSSVVVAAGPLEIGAGTENQWWGPGIRNALVLSNNAPGFPHVFARGTRPWETRVGRWEWTWIAGELSGSEYFDPAASDSIRSISGFAATLSPRGAPGLHVGITRTVYTARDPSRWRLAHATDVFTDWSGADERTRDERERPSEQLVSLFGRWVFPGEGLEVYGEWARYRLPLSLRDFLEQPHHTQGFTFGLQWANSVASELDLRLQAEATYLERSATYRLRPIGSFYTSLDLPHGYTNEGKVLGAAIGPGSSSQWLAADLLGRSFRLGLYGGRVRWNNDAYFRRLAPWLFFGHDVTLMGGIRGGIDWKGLRVDLEAGQAKRHNFLFQNWGAGWDNMDEAVDVTNRSFRLEVTPILF